MAGIQHIERIRAKAPDNALDRSCVEAKLAEARVGLQIAGDEMSRLDGALADGDAGEQDYAMRRLRLLADRAHDLTRAAQVCATDELSSIDVTRVDILPPTANVPNEPFPAFGNR